jgi:hypothetical protein
MEAGAVGELILRPSALMAKLLDAQAERSSDTSHPSSIDVGCR